MIVRLLSGALVIAAAADACGSSGGGTGGTSGSSGAAGSGGFGGGKTYHVDPVNGSNSGDGSAQKPWHTLQEVIQAGLFGATVKSGDNVLLRSGYHGELVLNSGTFASPVTIAAEAGHTPKLRRLQTGSVSGLVVRGLSISPSHAQSYATLTIVNIQAASSNVTIENNQLFSVADASGWTASDWVNVASSGVQVSGTGVKIRGNTVKNVRFGISVGGQQALVERNVIDGFSADGLRGLGDNGTFQYNTVKNCYVGDGQGDTNHDDGFQSWSVGASGVGTGEVKGIVLRGNTFINFENASHPLRTSMQGIGCFDGFFSDWVVENNVVITDHWHGISLYGARNSRVVNNTVIDNNSASPGPPWIMVTAHKDGRLSENVIVRNNLATDYDVSGTDVTQDHNVTLTAQTLASYFQNPAAFDLHLRAGSPAIDAGSSTLAPTTDRDGVARPQGGGFDLGAYEFR